VNVAVVPLIVPVPSVVVPSLKVTVPVTPAGTVAVKVTDWPTFDGLGEEFRAMFATPFWPRVALLTTWLKAVAELVVKLVESGVYTAVMV
jgi:hypothetical protein